MSERVRRGSYGVYAKPRSPVTQKKVRDLEFPRDAIIGGIAGKQQHCTGTEIKPYGGVVFFPSLSASDNSQIFHLTILFIIFRDTVLEYSVPFLKTREKERTELKPH